MNTLVLQPHSRRLEYSFFADADPKPLAAATVETVASDAQRTSETLAEALGACRGDPHPALSHRERGAKLDLIAIRVPYGGEEFDAPAAVNAQTVAKLRKLVAQDPLHTPGLLVLLECVERAAPHVPAVIVFDTAFFARLPARERLYGVDDRLARRMDLRRFGYHGVYHEAACLFASQPRRNDTPRILSICLEDRPEIAAVLGRRPVMVTGGATPLEGLPGRTSCGELDPGIVLMLAQKLHWGAEQINAALTRESGWQGLTGKKLDLTALMGSPAPECRFAAELLRYRMLLACGAAAAALGGVDTIVFSGRYAALARELGPWLQAKLQAAFRFGGGTISCRTFEGALDRLVADAAAVALRADLAGERAKAV